MSAEAKTLMVFGAGKLGGPVIDLLATRYPQHRYVLACRSADHAERRVNLTRYICSQWGVYPDLHWEVADLVDAERTAELVDRYRPDVAFNAATPFAWWLINSLPEPLSMLANATGHGVWGALDCVLPMKLSEALEQVTAQTTYVNGSYPDMVNAFLWDSPAAPTLGIGNLSNLVPGLRLTYASALDASPSDIDIHLVCHHFTSLNGPTLGSSGGAPYHLTVSYRGGKLTFKNADDSPFALLKSTFVRVRGLEGQGVTVSSAATVLASLLNGARGRHHTPGPLGLVGGYPIIISEDGSITVDLPPDLELSEAVGINSIAQRFDGIQEVHPGGITLTEAARQALHKIVGIDLPEVTKSNALPLAREIVNRLNREFGFRLNLLVNTMPYRLK